MAIGYTLAAWRYRNFISSAIRAEFRGRFASSKIGTIWFVLNPLAMAAIYAVVLSKILGSKIGGIDNEAGYAIYLMAGIASWGIFTELSLRCQSIFIEYANTMKKIAFPRIALPLIVLGGALINHGLLLISMVVIFALFAHYPTVYWALLPIGMLVTIGLAMGLGILLGVLNVFLRDVGEFMGIIFQLWFWLTPIVYPFEMLPDSMQGLIAYNPMLSLVQFYQDVLLYNTMPDFMSLRYPVILSIILLSLALFVFRRANSEIMDVL